MSIEWKDCTSYSRGDKERVPTAFELKLTNLRIVITCGHIYHKPNWVTHCHALHIDTKLLDAKSLDDAKIEAVGLVKKRIESLSSSLTELET